MMNIWISHILFSFLPFFNDLVPNISYSGFHSCSIQNTGIPAVYLYDGMHQRVLRDGYDRNHLGSPL